jgi:hypothetical protein
MTDRRCPDKSALLGERVARTLLALACLAAAGSAFAQQRPAPAAAAQAQPAETWRRDYTISLPLGDSTTRETLRLQAMNQARERASTEFGAIVLHEQALHGDALSTQTRVLSAGLVRLSLRSETVRQVQGDSTFWVDYAIQAQIDPAELERQAMALRSNVQRDLAIRALQEENEELRRNLRSAPPAAANPSAGAGPAAAPPVQRTVITPRIGIPDPGHASPLPDLAAQRARADAQAEQEREYAWSKINVLMLDAYRRAPKVVRHSSWRTDQGYRISVEVEFKVEDQYWNALGMEASSDRLVRASSYPGCFEFRESNHWFQSLKYSLYAEVSIGGVAEYKLLSAPLSVGNFYCGRRRLTASLLIPMSALEASREILVRVLPAPEVPIKLPPMTRGIQQASLRDEP